MEAVFESSMQVLIQFVYLAKLGQFSLVTVKSVGRRLPLFNCKGLCTGSICPIPLPWTSELFI